MEKSLRSTAKSQIMKWRWLGMVIVGLIWIVSAISIDFDYQISDLEKPIIPENLRFGPAIFPCGAAPDFASEKTAHQLHAIADAQHGYTEIEQGGIHAGSPLFQYRGGSPGEDQPGGGFLPDIGKGSIKRSDFRIDMESAKFPRDQLGVLGPEVKY